MTKPLDLAALRALAVDDSSRMSLVTLDERIQALRTGVVQLCDALAATKDAPAFIRGFNAGFDEARGQLAEAQAVAATDAGARLLSAVDSLLVLLHTPLDLAGDAALEAVLAALRTAREDLATAAAEGPRGHA